MSANLLHVYCIILPYRVEVSFLDLFGIQRWTQLRFDFAVYNEDGTLKCLIECQGEGHKRPVEEFGGLSAFEAQQSNDELKREYTREHDIPLIEIWNDKEKEIKKLLINKGILKS